jgi:hypothetical protein
MPTRTPPTAPPLLPLWELDYLDELGNRVTVAIRANDAPQAIAQLWALYEAAPIVGAPRAMLSPPRAVPASRQSAPDRRRPARRKTDHPTPPKAAPTKARRHMAKQYPLRLP